MRPKNPQEVKGSSVRIQVIGRALERSAMPAGPLTPVDSSTSEQHQLKYRGAPARALNSGIKRDPHRQTSHEEQNKTNTTTPA